MADIFLSVFTNAISLASEQIKRLWGVNEDLETLVRKVEMIQALLSDAAKKDPDSKAVQLWVKSLRDVATDADNLLDGIAYEGLRQKIKEGMQNEVSHFSSTSLAFCIPKRLKKALEMRSDTANQIKEINLALNNAYEEARMIGLQPSRISHTYSTEIRSDRITHPFVDESKIVGRGDDLEKILKRLTCSKDQNNLSVIGIVGMAGQGKTAIAQLIYKSEEVSKYFKKRIWLCVSEDFTVDKILKDMVESLSGKRSESTLRERIVIELKKKLKNNRFLLILDDVWNVNKVLWDHMRECLEVICGANGCRILVTTRSGEVLSTMHASFTHRLGTLSDADSWKLFEKIAFARGGAVETLELVDIGKRIVRRCGGVPLAIKTLGGLMYHKKYEQEWLEIEENKMWSSSGVAERAIKLSYDNLHSLSLKQCFAFCSIYAKDSVLEKERLVELWMAQGFLNPPPEGSQLDMERIGCNYFNALLQRSLLQDAQVNYCGEIVSCKMHDLVHDFALQVSKGYCLTLEGGVVDNDCTAVYLLIHSNGMVKMSKKRLQKVRTLILDNCGFAQINLEECKGLRVLVVHDFNIKNLPCSIGQLKHLRHLDIVNTDIKSLPDTITKLYHLQTLRIAQRFEKFPKDFGNMLNLRHVYIYGAGWGDFPQLPRIENLTSLRTLNSFQVSQDRKIEELSNLENLGGEVEIHGLENVSSKDEAEKAKLSDKKNITRLELYWKDRNTGEGCNDENVLEGLKPHSNLKVLQVECFAGESLPSWMVSQRQPIALRNLVNIILSEFSNCKKLPPLGHLPYLKVVAIKKMRSLKCIESEFYGFSYRQNAAASSSQTAQTTSSIVAFPSLQYLQLSSLSECEQWLDQSPLSFKLFPHLKELRVFGCHELNCIPDILTNLVSLEVLEIEACDNLISIPSVCGMRSLRELTIRDCKKLAALPSGLEACTSLQDFFVSSCDELSFIPDILTNLVSLEVLEIEACDNLVSIPSVCGMRSLRELTIRDCKKLAALPSGLETCTSLREFFVSSCDELSFIPDILTNLVSLEVLEIEACDNLISISSVCGMRSLRELKIEGCNKLAALPNGLEACASLQKLTLSVYSASLIQSLSSLPNLRELILKLEDGGTDSDCFTWPSTSSSTTASGTEHGILKHLNFDSLEYLSLEGPWSSKIKSLPEQIQHLPVLRKLELGYFNCMEALPEWLGNIHSLQLLRVDHCRQLAYLPSAEAMQRLTRLEIVDCPILRERCRKEEGPEWHKIAYIPHYSFI